MTLLLSSIFENMTALLSNLKRIEDEWDAFAAFKEFALPMGVILATKYIFTRSM